MALTATDQDTAEVEVLLEKAMALVPETLSVHSRAVLREHIYRPILTVVHGVLGYNLAEITRIEELVSDLTRSALDEVDTEDLSTELPTVDVRTVDIASTREDGES